MTDKDNSLEAIFYRMVTRQVPRQFHGRVMELFRKAVGRHQKDGDGRVLQAEPRSPLNWASPGELHAAQMQGLLYQSAAIMAQGLSDFRVRYLGDPDQQPPIKDDLTMVMPSRNDEGMTNKEAALDRIRESADRMRILNGIAPHTPTKPRTVAIPPGFTGLKVIPASHLPDDTIVVSQQMYDRIKASEPEPTQ